MKYFSVHSSCTIYCPEDEREAHLVRETLRNHLSLYTGNPSGFMEDECLSDERGYFPAKFPLPLITQLDDDDQYIGGKMPTMDIGVGLPVDWEDTKLAIDTSRIEDSKIEYMIQCAGLPTAAHEFKSAMFLSIWQQAMKQRGTAVEVRTTGSRASGHNRLQARDRLQLAAETVVKEMEQAAKDVKDGKHESA